jgi:hypothetical protein
MSVVWYQPVQTYLVTFIHGNRQREERALSNFETPLEWRKSSFSAQGNCLEWVVGPSSVRVRDSKNPTGPELVFTHSEWAAFVAGVKHGEADPSPN